ncbi:ArpU family phage packaging/lysis transcriptional regulator [Bacillus cereus]|uniref:ArpU family phage packaging/lysis transcriptional regulator n=1 Tax=Bacillus cereus TaxID=1396 RepID=UPI0003086E0B|nr:ArpU family phage packaging/lysis transcriptional regulator [Bacillus cereus]
MSEALKLDLNIKELDRGATVRQSLRALEKYRMLMLSVDDEYLPKVTATYSLTPPCNTNEFHSSTENIIDFVNRECERDTYMKTIWKGINRMPVESRELIVMKYMERDKLYDFEVYNQMGSLEDRGSASVEAYRDVIQYILKTLT